MWAERQGSTSITGGALVQGLKPGLLSSSPSAGDCASTQSDVPPMPYPLTHHYPCAFLISQGRSICDFFVVSALHQLNPLYSLMSLSSSREKIGKKPVPSDLKLCHMAWVVAIVSDTGIKFGNIIANPRQFLSIL